MTLDDILSAEDSQLDATLRATVLSLAPGENLTTADLVDRVCIRQSGTRTEVARKRLFARLARITRMGQWADCWSRGNPRKGRFGTVTPYLWHKPLAPCPHCGGTGFAPATGDSRAVEPIERPMCSRCALEPSAGNAAGLCASCVRESMA